VSDDEANNGEPNVPSNAGPEEIMIPKSQPLPPRRGSPIPLVIIGSAAIAAAAVGGALWWRSQQEAAALAEKQAAIAAQRLADAKKRPRVAGV